MGRNIKACSNAEPVVIARRKSGKQRFRSNNVHIVDGAGNVVARIVADVNHPLDCGARAYIETTLRIVDGDNPEVQLD